MQCLISGNAQTKRATKVIVHPHVKIVLKKERRLEIERGERREGERGEREGRGERGERGERREGREERERDEKERINLKDGDIRTKVMRKCVFMCEKVCVRVCISISPLGEKQECKKSRKEKGVFL